MNVLAANTENVATNIADDTLVGAAAIAAFIGDNVRRTHYLLEKGRLPAFQVGRIWKMRRSTYQAHVERLEQAAIARCAASN